MKIFIYIIFTKLDNYLKMSHYDFFFLPLLNKQNKNTIYTLDSNF